MDYPHNLDAERCVIGALVMGGADDRLMPKHFYHEMHERLFRTVERMRKEGVPTDAVTVREYASRWEGITVPFTEMVRLMEAVTEVAYLDTYVDIVLEHWQRRLMVDASQQLYRRAIDMTKGVPDTWARLGKMVDEQRKPRLRKETA